MGLITLRNASRMSRLKVLKIPSAPTYMLRKLARQIVPPIFVNASGRIVQLVLSPERFAEQAELERLRKLPEGQPATTNIFGQPFGLLFGDGGEDTKRSPTCETHCFGPVTSDLRLSMLYAAADVFVAPSRQENLANTVLEAMACGRLDVAFDIGGMADAIDHCLNGYLAKPYDTDDLAAGILWGLTKTTSVNRESARKKIETFFNQELQVSQYRGLYERLFREYYLNKD
jgi:glycosyltransferase involved in cell wall biosynthesis